jgi:hypothetical protein
MNPRVTAVCALDDHTLFVTFANGESKRFDMRPYFDYPAFRRLRDPGFFRKVKAADGTASWPDGIDFDPDTLFVDGVPTTSARATAAV